MDGVIAGAPRTERVRALALVALLLFAVIVWLGYRIAQGILIYPDELLTAERSREMLLLGRDTVHLNFQPSFAKPPLQYWLTTLTLPRLANASVAVRVWPLLYGVLTAIAVGWLASLVQPGRPWFGAAALAIYSSCPLFLIEASRALLDTGLTFFTTLAIALAQLAKRKPPWWLGVALACWLGTLQKIPLPLLVWAIIVVTRFCNCEDRQSLRTGWLIGSALLALLLVAAWPVYQYLHYGMPLARAFVADEPSQLFSSRNLGGRPYFEVLDGLLLSGWATGSLALAAAIALLFKWNTNPRMREIAIVALAIMALAVLFNFRSVRYIVPIIPCLSLALAFCLERLSEMFSWRWPRVLVALIVAAGFVQTMIKTHHRPRDPLGEKRAAEVLGTRQRENTTTIVIRPPRGKHDFQIAAFYLFYGRLRFPVTRVTVQQLAERAPPRPVLGVCLVREFGSIRQIYPDAQIVFTADDACCWETGMTATVTKGRTAIALCAVPVPL